MIDCGIAFITGILVGVGILFIFAYAHSSRIAADDAGKMWVWFDPVGGKAVSIESRGGKVRLFFAVESVYYALELDVEEFRKFKDAVNMFDQKIRGGKNE